MIIPILNLLRINPYCIMIFYVLIIFLLIIILILLQCYGVLSAIVIFTSFAATLGVMDFTLRNSISIYTAIYVLGWTLRLLLFYNVIVLIIHAMDDLDKMED